MSDSRPPARAVVALSALLAAPGLCAAQGLRPDSALIARGEYLARMGDCAACHTAQSGEPMAGGRELNTPFGIIHSTNITPDVATGIGRYSFGQFDRAVRAGIAADGRNLYPVMPYPSFAKIDPPDMRALFAYVMRAVSPVKRSNRDNDLQWPFSMRFGLSVWNQAFLDGQEYKPDPTRSAQWNRGAYIIEGPGHCGACHTPRGWALQEQAMGQDGSNGSLYLSGSTVDAWYAPSLRNLWPASEIAQFLGTGRNRHAAAYGSMSEVVHFSTQLFTDDDLAAMAEYLKSLSALAPSPAESRPTALAQRSAGSLYTTRGGLAYVQFCSTCHRLDGEGVADLFPPLVDNASILSSDPTSVIHVVLSGWKSAATRRFPRAFGMPRFSSLADRELAEIVSFVRTSWGNRAAAVSPEQVKKIRDEIQLQPDQRTRFATPRLADLLDSPNAEQLIYGMRLMTQTRALLPEHVGAGVSCSSCHPNAGTVASGSPFVGISALFPLYMPRAGRSIDFKERINGCFRRSMSGHALDRDSREMLAMVAYVDWMRGATQPNDVIPGRGNAKISDTLVPDAANGKTIYGKQCAVCHGDNGEGRQRDDGSYAIPPLWGNASFNIGAGMARTYTAAAFVKSNMPLADTLEFPLGKGALSDQEAVDVAEYFTHMARPDFPDKLKDWPNGGRPKDSRY